MTILEYRDLVAKETKGFSASNAINAINDWLDDYISASGTKKVVIGISGGKDSTVVAKLLVDKLGKENVFGLLMPNGEQKDIDDSIRVVKWLGIYYDIINIKPAYDAMLDILRNEASEEAKINIAPRIRMTTLYTYGQTHGYRVAGTGNLSERTLGYFTKWGDGASDFNIIGNFTSLEVMRIGEELGLPLDLVYKTPNDGLSGKSDEEKLGISYITVHKYLRKGFREIETEDYLKIRDFKERAQHKVREIPMVDYQYCQLELPCLGKEVLITLKNKMGVERTDVAFLTRTSFYPEGVVFESLKSGKDIRIGEIVDWKYTIYRVKGV